MGNQRHRWWALDDGHDLEVEIGVWELSGDFLTEGAGGEEMGDGFFS